MIIRNHVRSQKYFRQEIRPLMKITNGLTVPIMMMKLYARLYTAHSTVLIMRKTKLKNLEN